MGELMSTAEMRALERSAIDGGKVTGLDLMERAGRGVVEAVLETWPELAVGAHGAVVLCGPGNNGGDGFVVARLLMKRGWRVELFLYGDASRLPPDARANLERWREMGEVAPLKDDHFDQHGLSGGNHAIIVDAIFGTGLSRPFLNFRTLQKYLSTCASFSGSDPSYPRVVCVDVPSGMCGDTGEYLGDGHSKNAGIQANLTVTFHRKKRGHQSGRGPVSCGKLVVKDIGL